MYKQKVSWLKSKLLIVILAIILLVVYYLFGMDYMKHQQEHEVLTSDIIEVSQTLREIPQPPQDLEQRLAAAQASLAAEQNAVPSEINSTIVIDTILKLAGECEVKAIPLVTEPWSIENVGERGYYVFRLNIAVEGTFSQLVDFISKLENEDLKTLIVENLSVTRATRQLEGENNPEVTINIVVASLNLAVYTQSPTSD